MKIFYEILDDQSCRMCLFERDIRNWSSFLKSYWRNWFWHDNVMCTSLELKRNVFFSMIDLDKAIVIISFSHDVVKRNACDLRYPCTLNSFIWLKTMPIEFSLRDNFLGPYNVFRRRDMLTDDDSIGLFPFFHKDAGN